MKARSYPQRTCVGCREITEKNKLVRVVCQNEPGQLPRVVFDEQRQLPGRGAWIHRDSNCLKTAIKKGAFNRAFRGRVDAQALALVDEQWASGEPM